jgi:glycosyltransferase involved in cell wall biosynthesis
MKIFVAIPNKFAGCGFYRQYQPHNRLAKTTDCKVLMSAGIPDDAWKYDIWHVHKGYYDLDAIKKAQERGIAVVADFDDWWNLDTEHIFYKDYLNNNASQELIKLLKAADYVTCTTHLLANEIRKHNRRVVVLPNAMDMDYDGCQVRRVMDEKIIFGYVGGHCHMKDVEQLRGLNNRLSSYNNYKFRLFGYDGSEVYNVYADVFSDSGRLAGTHFDYAEKQDVFSYPQFYNWMDVSLVPLVDNKFNSLKSELKLIEAGFFRKAVIVDNVEPYKRLLKHMDNCLVVNKPKDWYRNAKYLLDNPDEIKRLGENLYKTVQPFHIDRVNEKRYNFYKDVLKERNTNSSDRHSRLSLVNE